LIELIYACERAKELIDDEEIVSREFRVKVERKGGEGIGCIEAPRGTLIHHYWADDRGRITRANLIVATIHNNQAINMSIREAAKKFIGAGEVKEGILNRIEMAIRCYDPCLSCATHTIGQMPLEVKLVGPDGKTIQSLRR
jgi:NAD-reducing hydrogenase large subunit